MPGTWEGGYEGGKEEEGKRGEKKGKIEAIRVQEKKGNEEREDIGNQGAGNTGNNRK